jgi:PTS system ascorbate-specific IIA component
VTTGLLIISHENIGTALVDTASLMLEMCPMALELLPVSPGCTPEPLFDKAMAAVRRLDRGTGVLVLTDMYGSTPSNVANLLAREANVMVVAGLNLPMLVRVFNYPGLSLQELAQKAMNGGRDGIFICEQDVMC